MAKPRALYDTNLYLNFLMSPAPAGTAIDFALDAAAEGRFALLFPQDVIEELGATITRRLHLSSRVQQRDVDALLDRVKTFAILLPPLEDDVPALTRDPHDDYLLALAVLNAADYLVTRDHDLLDLGEALGVSILDPADFLRLLRSTFG